MTALLLLSPQTPMLFQGEEFDASSPFPFFADHGGDLARLVREGAGDVSQAVSQRRRRRSREDDGRASQC